MNSSVFSAADILIPGSSDMTKWSVVACDQYSSEPEYWDRVNEYIADVPSTLRLITPEAYLDRVDASEESKRIRGKMEEYLSSDLFTEHKNSYIYIERTQLDGSIRKGLVGKIDLEAYDYTPGSGAPIAASERTVVSRLPVRIEIRKNALIELPHVMVFFSDPEKTVLESIEAKKNSLKKVYDFDLIEKGGNIKGWLVEDEVSLPCRDGATLVIGDGNHSLAAAKELWKTIKPTLSVEEQENHPARYALVEINNVYDDSIQFEPIHRVVFDTDPTALISYINKKAGLDGAVSIPVRTADGDSFIYLPKMPFGDIISTVQSYIESFISEKSGTVDYIHGDDEALSMGSEKGCIAFLLPKMEKSELFATVAAGKVFPKKSFSVGLAPEKRYYLECRKITK